MEKLSHPFPYRPSIVASVIGILLSVLLFLFAQEQEQRLTQRTFNLQSETEFADIHAALNRLVDKLGVVRGFVRNKLVVEGEERIHFLDFLFLDKSVDIHSGWETTAWIPRVHAKDLPAFRQQAIADGWKDSISFQPPQAGATHVFPSYYIETRSFDLYPVGLDFSSIRDFADLFQESADAGAIRMSLRRNRDGKAVLGLAWPLYSLGYPAEKIEMRRKTLLGFVYGEWAADDVLKATVEKFHWSDRHIRLELVDGERLHPFASMGGDAKQDGDVSWQNSLEFAGRTVRVSFVASRDFIHAQANGYQWMALTAGLLLTAMLVFYLRMQESSRDKIERKVHEKTAEYHEMHSRLLGLLEHLQGGLGFEDSQGHLCLVNQQLPEMLGLKHVHELTGRHRYELIQQLNKTLAEESHLEMAYFHDKKLTFNLQNPDGERHYELDFVPIRNGRGLQGAIWFLREVTERVNLDRSFEHAQRLESLGLLAGGIAHDFNNILTAIMGNLSLLRSKLRQGMDVSEYISRIHKASDQAANLCRQMLAYSGKGQMFIEPIDLNVQIRGIVELLKVSVPKHIQQEMQLAETLPLIEGDIAQIQQVILNLVKNAGDAINGHAGHVWVTTGMEYIEMHALPPYLLPMPAAGEYVVISISDDGCGMSEATLARIFDPFFTTKQDGHGLGMSAVLGIMRGHRGFIEVNSAEGQGTHFRICFPVAEVREVLDASSISDGIQSLQGTVLLVDDEERIRDSTADLLHEAGLTVLHAMDGLHALEVFHRHANEIDLILMDISMPRMNGIECMHRIHAMDPACKVILTSGFYEQDLRLKYQEALQTQFIQKPYDPGLLMSLMCEHLDSRKGEALDHPA